LARKRKSSPTKKSRSGRQRIKDRYAHAREDAQLAGLIPTTPEEALGDERVDPASQGSQPLPGLIGRAVRSGWATPEPVKVAVVDEMSSLVLAEGVEPHVKVAAARVLQQGDQAQWERDNPELAGKTRGGTRVEVNNNTQVNLLDAMREAAARPDALEEAKRKALEGRDGHEGTGAGDSGGGQDRPQAPEDEDGGPVRVVHGQDQAAT
jgi:hypothetical protein